MDRGAVKCIRPLARSQRLIMARFLSLDGGNKNIKESSMLADALNLLSPTSKVNNTHNYKPSIFDHLTKGSINEQIKKSPRTKDNEKNQVNFQKSVKGLLDDLSIVSSKDFEDNFLLLEAPIKQQKMYIRSITQESRLLQLIRLFFYQDKLSLNLLTEILLNPNFTKISALPFYINQLPKRSAANWTPINFVQLDIVLLKKFHDINKSFSIFNNLKQNFETIYLPLIKNNELSPFYERIIWKFYFDFTKELNSEDESYYIKHLNNLKTSVLIWESSLFKSSDISKSILNHFASELNTLQKLFFQISSNSTIESIVIRQLMDSKYEADTFSPLLSDLKRVSIKYKLYSLPADYTDISTDVRASSYLLVNSLERILEPIIKKHPKDTDLQNIYSNLKDFRVRTLMNVKDMDGLETQKGEMVNWHTNFLAISKK